MSTLSARAALALVAALVAAASVTATSSAFFPVPQGPVIPNVMFGALVNGASSNAVVRMGCFGAVRPGQTGHPMSGQTVEVFRPEALLVSGFTGTVADRIVAEGLTVRDVERLGENAGAVTRARTKAPHAIDADTLALEERLSLALGVKVTIRHAGGSGDIRIAFRNFEQLDDFCRRLCQPAAR